MSELTPTLLLILDGWGVAPQSPGNAVSLANTPNLDRIVEQWPRTTLQCAGRAVGLPDGFMGNSEVGHMNIGAGRVVYQDMTRIDLAIEEGSLADNPVLADLMQKTKAAGGTLHFMGLISDGGVHSHVLHLHALLQLAKEKGVPAVVHAFMDGRDTPPTSGLGYLRDLKAFMDENGLGSIASVAGRYWAMDRDNRWERNKEAYDALVLGRGTPAVDPVQAVQDGYDAGENDEFIKPRVVQEAGKPIATIDNGDGVFFFNFRADRARQIVRSLFDKNFNEFRREKLPELAGFATMTEYESSFGLPVAFSPQAIEKTLGETVAALGAEQLRIAETEKYAHVTYFLNCGREEPFAGEERQLIPSPREVPTYDHKPEMSCPQVTDKLIELWNTGRFALVVCNLANLDMVGHTGIIDAAIKAAETVDASVGRIVETVLGSGGRVLLTADHGNAEEMLDEGGNTQTAHSKNAVPFVLLDNQRKNAGLAPGKLGDIAPTILRLWGVQPPEEMTGQCIVNLDQGNLHE